MVGENILAEINKNNSAFDKEKRETIEKVLSYKLASEANIVAILYKDYKEFYNINLALNDFSNNIWRVYFKIAYDIILVEKKNSLDDITVGLYLEKHPKLKTKFDEYGGYNTIVSAMSYVDVKNLEGYILELRKWNAVIELLKQGFFIQDRLSEFADMTAEEIYNEFTGLLNNTFVNVDSSVKSYDLADGIHELIERLDKGSIVGLPYYDMPILTKETGGQYMGSITLLGGISNAGKSTVARSTTIPSILQQNQKIIIMVNEDSREKWQREMLVWICNNVLKFDIQKHIIRDGRYSPEVKTKLHEAGTWLEEKSRNHTLTIIPFSQYRTSLAIKEIRKYAAMGVKYFLLDTFKMDAGKVSGNSWLEMQQAMVDIKDVVKTEALNVHILITFQLEKGSSVMRYYTQNNIGMAKNIVDVASTCIMIRDVFDDEYPDGKKKIKVHRLDGNKKKTKIEQPLDKEKKYQIFFIVKNQEGAANSYQIVAEHDKSRNIIKEIGITNISPDF